MVEAFNCTFPFFANKFYPYLKENFDECTIWNVTAKSVALFYDIIKDDGEGNN